MKKVLTIVNTFDEELDVLIEGNESAQEVIVFVHGFGTDKGEGEHLFAELAEYLANDFLIIRFDQSGYGKSQGRQVDASPLKASKDLKSVISYAREQYITKNINIYAHSMGTIATAMLSPDNVRSIVFTGAISSHLSSIASRISERIESKGGKVFKDGVSVYPRTSGAVQEIGSEFWRVLVSTDFVALLKDLVSKTRLTVIKSKQDEIVGSGPDFDKYRNIADLEYKEIQGSHNFADKEDREELFKELKRLFLII